MIYEEDVLEYLDHAGVKGMKWGVRKAQPRSAEEQARRKATFGKVKKAATAAGIATAVGVGLVVASRMLTNQGSARFGATIRRGPAQNVFDFNRIAANVKNTKVSSLPKITKPAIPKLPPEVPDAVRQLIIANKKLPKGALKKKLMEEHNRLIDAANADLLRRDKLMEIPIRDRSYLNRWA